MGGVVGSLDRRGYPRHFFCWLGGVLVPKSAQKSTPEVPKSSPEAPNEPILAHFGSNSGVFSLKISKINKNGTNDAPKRQKAVVAHLLLMKNDAPGGRKTDQFLTKE